MNGDDMKCGQCKFYSPNNTGLHEPATGHGTCHVNPPGHNGGRGFPIISAVDWCGEFKDSSYDIVGSMKESVAMWKAEWTSEKEVSRKLAQKLGLLIERSWWQRLLNVIPWEKK